VDSYLMVVADVSSSPENEKYADEAAFAAHRASDHFREIGLGKLMPMAVVRDVQLFSAPAPVPPVRP
jgi:hypothetical protein